MSTNGHSRTDGVEIRAATAYDMECFYRDGAPCTAQAWVVSYKGVPQVMAGVTLEATARGAFMSIKPGAMDLVSKRAAWELSKEVFSLMKTAAGGCHMLAVTDGKTPTADSYLRCLGFEHLRSWREKEIYRWIWEPAKLP